MLAALELASEKGLSGVSMSQIAEKVGIRKPSLYNHFASKDEMIAEMYSYFRERSKDNISSAALDFGRLAKEKSLEDILRLTVGNYSNMSGSGDMLRFYKVIYAERAIDPNAALIVAEETEKMIMATQSLFYALQAHGKIYSDNIDMSALSFAMTIHSLLDHRLDRAACAERSAPTPFAEDMIDDYIKWFCRQHTPKSNNTEE